MSELIVKTKDLRFGLLVGSEVHLYDGMQIERNEDGEMIFAGKYLKRCHSHKLFVPIRVTAEQICFCLDNVQPVSSSVIPYVQSEVVAHFISTGRHFEFRMLP